VAISGGSGLLEDRTRNGFVRAVCAASAALLLAVGLSAGEGAAAGLPRGPLAEAQRRETALAAQVAGGVVAVECHAGPRNERYYGAGVVVTPDGLILSATTAVPAGAREIQVRFADGSAHAAEAIVADPNCETVVLALKPVPLVARRFVPIGEAGHAQVGDPVFAAGNPHETLVRDGQVFWSAGTLTGRYRTRSADESSGYAGEVLETDAAVNPGCDGGALVDGEGRLVGVLSLCYTRARWLGTAVPIERVLAQVPERVREALAAAARQAPEAPGAVSVPKVLRQAASPVAAAVVRLYVRRTPQEPVAARASETPHAASVGLPSAHASAMAARPSGAVTGVLIEPRGTILTSAFNVEGAGNPVEVVLGDGRRFHAKVRGRHVDLDVAVLQLEDVDHEPLPALALAAGPTLRPGRFLGVLGAPPTDGAEPTWGGGIVSGLDRLDGLAVQMDAKTNYGNAGGPVVDLEGRLVGSVSQVGTRKIWAQNSGVSFFAPSDRILAVLKDLRSGKTLRNPPAAFLGVAPAIGETDLEGVSVSLVVKNSPAWKGGLREGDLITAVDGQAVRSWPALLSLLKTHRAGEQVSLQVVRGKESRATNVMLGERSE
jgi:S1-C subfamily serine protease